LAVEISILRELEACTRLASSTVGIWDLTWPAGHTSSAVGIGNHTVHCTVLAAFAQASLSWRARFTNGTSAYTGPRRNEDSARGAVIGTNLTEIGGAKRTIKCCARANSGASCREDSTNTRAH
jgi:hypothetical protein